MADDLMEVDLPGGVKARLTKEEAAKVISGRDEMKSALRARDEELGRIKAEKEAAEKNAARSADEKAAIEAAKKGEVDAARDLLTKEFRERETKIVTRLKRDAVKSLLGPKVVESSIDDAAALLERRVSFDLDSQQLIILDEAGQPLKDQSAKPVTAEAFLPGWLKDRPHFVRDSTQSGSGAAGGGKAAADAQAIPQSQYEAWVKGNRPDLQSVMASGKYRIVEG